MGNREDLLAGARKVIIERGVAKATARDIASAAGVSLAAIGYHFGSKDQLITEALTDSLGTAIGDSMERKIREGGGAAPLAAFAALWNGMPAVFAENHDSMLASMENLVRVARSPQLQKFFAQSLPGAYRDIADALRQAHPRLSEDQAEAIAELYFVLVQGLGVLRTIAPEANLPDGDRLAQAVAALTGGEG
ncbi:TetR/AcrR family transcriptional regulator [Nocardia implantans]|uniref:Helix-turn-helix domain-containing protein n=1 Tax=Nocardia implantans TaxID=3108168 RepID=A0ABU6ARB1_9NOCA|nr:MULTISPECIES: TetR/AcrR family transcriptional regulator [unclassified Nocardia]MBF6191457.1 TetR/AcrR family transcriptional regulator [Nocardia beijingensis]MEA3528236.1 helix-turn-helix domain-containing protein [Nocardia sp. CDC192]MEB3510014.1 helix-turn-helix domain-containing protein [Nocardia sp. CDC186]